MCHKIIKMDSHPGGYAWRVAGIEHELDEWEAYNFWEQRWVPARNFCMFWVVPYPYIEGSFEAALQVCIKHLPLEATVYIYEGNETFGALRRVNRNEKKPI